MRCEGERCTALVSISTVRMRGLGENLLGIEDMGQPAKNTRRDAALSRSHHGLFVNIASVMPLGKAKTSSARM